MKTPTSVVVVVVIAAMFGATRLAAQDLNLMAKWSAAEVVHYDVAMQYDGEVELARPDGGAIGYRARVKDRVEIAFDWNQNEMKIVGTPTIKNFPSTTAPGANVGSCPPVRVDGTFEYAEVTALQGIDYNPALQLITTRSYPALSIPLLGDLPSDCGKARTDRAAKSEAATDVGLIVLPSLYLGAPTAGGPGVKVDAERSTITSAEQGWTNTYKLSIE